MLYKMFVVSVVKLCRWSSRTHWSWSADHRPWRNFSVHHHRMDSTSRCMTFCIVFIWSHFLHTVWSALGMIP